MLVSHLSACAHSAHRDPIAWCTSRSPLLATLPTTTLTGRFDLELTATRGEKRGRSARGVLELHARDSAASTLTVADDRVDSTLCEPYAGAATIDLASVNAFTEGTAASRDSAAPGVVIQVRSDPREPEKKLQLSIGSKRNRRDIQMLDGADIEAVVEEVTSSGFRGRWESSPATLAPPPYSDGGVFSAKRIR
jgi:hypothetical protein